jgi:hypothetical protein
MSPTTLRGLAVTVAVIIAVLTGLATGLLSGPKSCSLGGASTPATTTTGGTALNAKPAAAREMTCTTAAFGVTPALTAFVGTAFAGGALLLLLVLASTPKPSSGRAPDGAPGRAAEDRAALIKAAIYVRDRVTSKALADRLGAALHDAGVETLEPTGARFDPARHEAGGATPADDPARIGSIAAVEVPGYADRGGRILRAPVVTVYQGNPASRGGTTGGNPR